MYPDEINFENPDQAKNAIGKLHETMKAEYEKIRTGPLSGLLKLPRRIHSEEDFILELIQNADDAKSENLFIEWTNNWIVVQNDGDPFEEIDSDPDRQNVSAICEFDRSTKHDKIGFMGIGFKSVFKISDRVEIYSGPFRFYFDEQMCVPQWISSPCEVAKPLLSNVSQRGSLFCINIAGHDQKDTEPVREIINRLSSNMLLWLQNLRTIHYGQKIIEKKEGPISHSFRLVDNSKERLYRCFSSDKIKVEEEPLKQLVKVRNVEYKKDLEKAPVMKSVGISFSIDEKGRIKETEGQCYAFLPLPEVDLRTHFDIQGDFNVELRRKTLKSSDDKYNNWLFGLVGMAWEKAFECYKKYEDPKMALQMYRIAPLVKGGHEANNNTTRKTSPFETIKKSINAYMCGHKTVLVEMQGKRGQIKTRWTKPSLCILPLQNDLRNLFNYKDLEIIVGKKLHWVSKHMPDEGMEYLKQLNKSKDLDALDFISDWQKFESIAKNKVREKHAYEWFAKFSILIAELYNNINSNERYRSNPWTIRQKLIENFPVLLSNGAICRKEGDNQKIFYTPPSSKKLKETGPSTVLQCIHPKILAFLRKKTENDKEDERRARAIEFLEKNILTVLDSKGQFKNIILPILEREKPSKLGEKFLDEVITFIFQNRKCWDIAQNKVPLTAEDGNFCIANRLYLSSPYGGQFDATKFFGGINDSALLSRKYLRKLSKLVPKRRKDPKKVIRDFFEKIGVTTGITISSNIVWISEHDLEKRIGKKPRPTRHSGYRYSGYNIQDPDFADERVSAILKECSKDKENAENSFNRLSVFLHELIRNWQEFSKHRKARYYRFDPDLEKSGRQSQIEEEVGWSKWVEFLSRSDNTWIPAKLGDRMLRVGPRGALFDKETVTGSIPVVHIDRSKSSMFRKNRTEFSNFFRFIGWEAMPGPDEIIAEIHSMCERKVKEKKTFIAKYNILRAEIEKISDTNQKNKIISQLDSRPWIFTPSRKTKYRTSIQVQWESQNELLDWKVGMRRIYPEMEYFFKDLMKVHSATTVGEYIVFLQNILWKKRSLSIKEFESLCSVYMKLDALLSDDGSEHLVELDSWQEVKSAFKFYCRGNSWHSPSEGVYYVDDENFLTKLGKNRRNVFIVKLSPTLEKNPPNHLFEETGLNALTHIKLPDKAKFTSVLKKDGDWIRNDLKLTTQTLISVIKSQRRTLFSRLEATRVFENLKSAEVIYVDGLRVITPLLIGEPLETEVDLFLQQDGHKISILISKSMESSHDRIKRLLCKELNKLMDNFLGAEFIDLVWGKEPEDAVDVVRDYKDLSLKKGKNKKMANPENLVPVSSLSRLATRDLIIEKKQEIPPRRIKSLIKKRGFVKKLGELPYEEEKKMDWSRNAVEEQAISLVLQDENEHNEHAGYVARDVHKRKMGYDVVVVPIHITSSHFNEKKHGHLVKKFIEIKASKVDSDDFVITDQEWEKAEYFKERYFLYRVINTMSKHPIAFVIDYPVEQYRDAIVERTARVIEDWRKRAGVRMKEILFGRRSS